MATIYTNHWDSVECTIPGEYEIGQTVQLEVEFATGVYGRYKTRTLLVDAKITYVSKSRDGAYSWAKFDVKVNKKVRT
jgi:hypothetical protein